MIEMNMLTYCLSVYVFSLFNVCRTLMGVKQNSFCLAGAIQGKTMLLDGYTHSEQM